MFKGRNILIATKHHKELVLAPLLARELGIGSFVPDVYDTDALGTFTGEIERKDDPLTTLRKKCLGAMEKFQSDLGIASEGSFGAHPYLMFCPANEELLILIDQKNNLEIVARELNTNTNFSGAEIKNERELLEFAIKAQFPSHGLILRKKEGDATHLEKGIQSWQDLNLHFTEFKKLYGKVYIETDMRAMYNPTRMKNIEKACQQLISKIKSTCPNCQWPGFEITEWVEGLPCENCFSPTKGVLAHIYECKKCKHQVKKEYPQGSQWREARFCDFCNP